MKAALLLASVALVAGQQSCSFNKTSTKCPVLGQECNQKQLCATGLYCRATKLGDVDENGRALSYRGVCSREPDILSVSDGLKVGQMRKLNYDVGMRLPLPVSSDSKRGSPVQPAACPTLKPCTHWLQRAVH